MILWYHVKLTVEFIRKEEDVPQIAEQTLFWVYRKPDKEIHKHTCTSLFDNAVCVIVAATSQSGTARCNAMKNCKYSGYFGQHQIIMLFSLAGVVKKLSTHICS